MKMTKKIIATLLALAMTMSLAVAVAIPTSAAVDIWDGTSVATTYAGGTGTETDPYQIATAAQLAFLAAETELASTAGKYFKLTADINLADKPWPTIGSVSDVAFKGVFDGDGYTISGLNCVNEDVASNTYAGVFGYINAAVIKNLNVTGSKILAKYAGAIVGYGVKGSRIVNCTSNIEVIDGVTVGGIAGRMQDAGAEILFCTNESTIKPFAGSAAPKDHFMGGIVGAGGGLLINYCANKGDIICDIEGTSTANHYHVGGIIGVHGASSNPVDVKYCYNLGNISGYSTLSAGNAASAGGIVGRGGHVDNGTVVGCFSTGTVTWPTEKGGTDMHEQAGGIVGWVKKTSTYTDCYTTMDILVGKNEAQVDISTLKTLTLAEMQGPEALTNMNLGSSVGAILDATVETSVANANYRDAVLTAFGDYTGGKTLVEYVNEKVREKLNLTGGADIWITAAGKTPELGSVDALMMSSEIPTLTAAAAEEVLKGLYDQYQADPKYTTTEEEVTTDAPAEETTTEPQKQTVVIGQDTTPADNVTTKAPDSTTKTEEKSCGGFAAAAAIIAVVVASLSCAIVIKKN